MRYLKTFEQNSIEKYQFFIDSVRYDLLVTDSDELSTYKYDENGEYKLAGPLSVEEYIDEKMLNHKCEFYCNSCWVNHTGNIIEISVFDPVNLNTNEEPNGPWVKVKYTEFGADKVVLASNSEEWHDIDPYSQITVYGEQSDLSKKQDKIRREIVDYKEAVEKYNI